MKHIVEFRHYKIFALFLSVWFVYGPALAQQRAAFDSAGEAQLVDLINQARAARGLVPLVVDNRLTQAARQHSASMAQRSTLTHQFAGEPAPEQRITNSGVPSDAEGENVDLDQRVEGAHYQLMHSPPHRANILDPKYNAIGVGIVRSGPNIWVTEDFAHVMVQYSEPQAESAAQSAINAHEQARGFPVPTRRPQTSLRHIACNMGLDDQLDLKPASQLPGVHEAFAWTTSDPGNLPNSLAGMLRAGLPAGYSLGACFAPSVSHPGGIYWLVMVSY